jgi:hypothetical protein
MDTCEKNGFFGMLPFESGSRIRLSVSDAVFVRALIIIISYPLNWRQDGEQKFF